MFESSRPELRVLAHSDISDSLSEILRSSSRSNRNLSVRRFPPLGRCLLGISGARKHPENVGCGPTGGGRRTGIQRSPPAATGQPAPYCHTQCDELRSGIESYRRSHYRKRYAATSRASSSLIPVTGMAVRGLKRSAPKSSPAKLCPIHGAAAVDCGPDRYRT